MKKIIVTAIIAFFLGGAIMFFFTRNNIVNLIEKPGRKPFANIGFAMAQHLVGQYKPGTIPRPTPIETTAIVGNTQTVWFDINTLSELLDEVETKVPQGDGVRLYFATYDDNYSGIDSRGIKQNYSNANTLILVPTFTKPMNGINYHWDVSDNGDTTKKIGFIASLTDYQNKGELCPPPANCKLTGATLLP